MKKLRAFFYVYAKSLSSLNYYKDIVNTGMYFSFKYFITLALIISVIMGATTVYKIIPELTRFFNEVKTTALQQYPQDLVITSENGSIKVNQPEPYFIPTPDYLKDADVPESNVKNFITFYSQGTIEDLDRLETHVLINDKNIISKGSQGKIEVYPTAEVPDKVLDRPAFEKFVGDVSVFFKFVPYIIFVLAFIFVAIYNVFIRLLLLLPLAFLFFVLGSFRNLGLPFSKYFKIGMHVLTLPITLEILFALASFRLEIPMWQTLLALGFGFAAVLNLDKKEQTV